MFRTGAIINLCQAQWVAVQAWAPHFKKEEAKLDTAQKQKENSEEGTGNIYSQKARGPGCWPSLWTGQSWGSMCVGGPESKSSDTVIGRASSWEHKKCLYQRGQIRLTDKDHLTLSQALTSTGVDPLGTAGKGRAVPHAGALSLSLAAILDEDFKISTGAPGWLSG